MSTVEGGDEQDLTRKQRREQAREQRKQLEQEQASRAVRRARLTQLGVVIVIVVAIIVGILIATGGGGKSGGKAPEGSAAEQALVSEVSSDLGGIPQSGVTLGNPAAPVTLQYFGDLQCPVCKEFTLHALKPLIAGPVRQGKLKIEYRNLETATREPETFRTQQTAAMAAGKQQRAWYYIELFYHQQGEEHSGYVNEAFLQGVAKQVPGLDVSKWQSDRSNPEFASTLTTDSQAATKFGFTGTPSFAIGKTGGTMQKFEAESFTDPASFEAAIRRLGG